MLLIARALAGLLLALLSCQASAAGPADAAHDAKVLRYAIRVAETGFDPAQVTDDYSRMLAAAVLEPPLQYAYLARPIQLRPNTATALPEVSADFRTLTFHIRPGIHFADDPAFKGPVPGKGRELVAEDYVYTLKRHYDPALNSGNLYVFQNAGVLGLDALREAALKGRTPFDYDQPVEGVQALDRYTFRVRTKVSNPRFVHQFADVIMGAVAREVVEFYGDKIMGHPVGTGPWRLVEWRRSSFMAFERNPNYREVRYDEQAPAEAGPGLAAQAEALRGRRLPMLDRVEVSVIEASQPRWLSFLNAEADAILELPSDFAPIAIPGNKLAPNLARRGVQMVRFARTESVYSYFGMENPIVGGYTPDKVALRRAISLGIDVDKQIRLARRGQAIPGQAVVGPGAFGYDPGFKTEMSEFNRAKSRALLDLYGYTDKDGDGWRDMPDGSPLVLELTTETDGQSRALAELWQKDMKALNLRIQFRFGQWPENLKASRAGKLMMWAVSWSASIPDGQDFLELGYGPNKGQSNDSRFDLPAYNALFERQQALPDGPERQQLIQQMERLWAAYMPAKVHVHRIWTDLAQPWLIGYQRNLFWPSFWQYVDIDTARKPQR